MTMMNSNLVCQFFMTMMNAIMPFYATQVPKADMSELFPIPQTAWPLELAFLF